MTRRSLPSTGTPCSILFDLCLCLWSQGFFLGVQLDNHSDNFIHFIILYPIYPVYPVCLSNVSIAHQASPHSPFDSKLYGDEVCCARGGMDAADPRDLAKRDWSNQDGRKSLDKLRSTWLLKLVLNLIETGKDQGFVFFVNHVPLVPHHEIPDPLNQGTSLTLNFDAAPSSNVNCRASARV